MIVVSGETSECLYEAGEVVDEREARRFTVQDSIGDLHLYGHSVFTVYALVVENSVDSNDRERRHDIGIQMLGSKGKKSLSSPLWSGTRGPGKGWSGNTSIRYLTF